MLEAATQAPLGYYKELSPRELAQLADLPVLLFKAQGADSDFDGFRQVMHCTSNEEVEAMLPRLESMGALAVICPTGACSGRLAIRLSRLGLKVYHLGGGLVEWRHYKRRSCCQVN